MSTQVDIDLEERSYPIIIERGLLDVRERIAEHLAGRQVLIISNEVVAPLYLGAVRAACEGRDVVELILADGEAEKTVDNWHRVLDALAAQKASRDVTLVALGGGVVGDLTGFAAASWMRGVPFVQIPTTLLAQVDASVGGKTAVNHAAGKNLIGAFHQPRAVLIDTHTLATLAEREYLAGLAEVVKYGLIRDAEFLRWLEEHADALLARDAECLEETIARCCRHKAEVVAADEREGGVRALLNLGHTFGHAIEAVAGYGEVLHGEAVAMGCRAAAELSQLRGDLSAEDTASVRELLLRLRLPVTIPDTLSEDALLAAMALDKKNVSGRLRLILLRAIGDAWVRDDVEEDAVRAAIARSRPTPPAR